MLDWFQMTSNLWGFFNITSPFAFLPFYFTRCLLVSISNGQTKEISCAIIDEIVVYAQHLHNFIQIWDY